MECETCFKVASHAHPFSKSFANYEYREHEISWLHSHLDLSYLTLVVFVTTVYLTLQIVRSWWLMLRSGAMLGLWHDRVTESSQSCSMRGDLVVGSRVASALRSSLHHEKQVSNWRVACEVQELERPPMGNGISLTRNLSWASPVQPRKGWTKNMMN